MAKRVTTAIAMLILILLALPAIAVDNDKPLFTFAVLADIQYADAPTN